VFVVSVPLFTVGILVLFGVISELVLKWLPWVSSVIFPSPSRGLLVLAPDPIAELPGGCSVVVVGSVAVVVFVMMMELLARINVGIVPFGASIEFWEDGDETLGAERTGTFEKLP